MSDRLTFPGSPPHAHRDGGSASSKVYEDLRQHIVALTMPPDTTIDRAQMATRYGVSQQPVREALKQLEQDGLVKAFPQSRTVVTRIDLTRVREEHFLRVAAECEVARTLAGAGGAPTLTTARGLLRMQEALVGDVEQIDLFRQLDDAFHECLFEGVGQLGLYRHIRSRSGNLARVRTLDLPSDGKMRAVLDAHVDILKGIEAADTGAASDAMRQHLSGTVERLAAIFEGHQQFFGGAPV